MKKKIVALTIGLCALFSAALPTFAMSKTTRESDYIDMNAVVSYDVTETGIMFYFEDGTGYYLDKMEVEAR